MSAQIEPLLYQAGDLLLCPMQKKDLGAVIDIENTIYTFPWTERNFSDSMDAGYSAWVLSGFVPATQRYADLYGYFVLMVAADEAHLLNLSVALPRQRNGHGLHLLGQAIRLAREYHTESIVLEVRVSNRRAIDIYERAGFRQIGLRKGYYPFSSEDPGQREDATVMRMDLQP